MKLETLEKLQRLQKKFGIRGSPSGPFGKIVQKLLALSFYEIGATNIVERGVQGVDIDITLESNQKYTLEVKTTEKLLFSLTSDNVQALRERSYDRYQPVIAVLRLAPFENWVFAKIPINEVSTGMVLIDTLIPYRMKELESELEPKFDFVVQKHFKDVWNKGEKYLIEELKMSGAEIFYH